MIRTAHLNQKQFEEQAEQETLHILDEKERAAEKNRLCSLYFQRAMDDPIMQADAHPYRIRHLMPGEIEVIPFIFAMGDMGDILCPDPDAPLEARSWRVLFNESLKKLDGQVYFEHQGIYFGFPKCMPDDALRKAAILLASIHKWDPDPDMMRMMAIAAYWFEDIVQNPAYPWPSERLAIFTSHTKFVLFDDYMRKFPHLMPQQPNNRGTDLS